jgi:hypothetical protein
MRMSDYEITDSMLARPVVDAEDLDRFPEILARYEEGDRVPDHFGSVGAFVAYAWSLDSFQDEDCGTAGRGNDWHGMFWSDHVILRCEGTGHISAWRVGPDYINAEWAKITAGAVEGV